MEDSPEDKSKGKPESKNGNEIVIPFQKEVNEEKILSILKEYFENKDSKEKKNSISKENYELIIQFIKYTPDEALIQFIDFLNDLHLLILQVLIEGYFKIDFEEDKNKEILEQLGRLFRYFFSKSLFKCVYKQLSKIFRKNCQLKDINTIQKLEKIFVIWKLLYNIENYPYNPEKTKDSGFENQDYKINIKHSIFEDDEYIFIMEIFFNTSEIFKKMNKDNAFYFIQFNDSEQRTFNFSYLKNFEDNSESLFKDKENKITITLTGDEVSLEINDKKISSKKHELKNDIKIGILNYFFYENITQINIEIKNTKDKNSPSLKGGFKKDQYFGFYQINYFYGEEKEKYEKLIALQNAITYTIIKFRKNREWVKRKKGLEDIKYYGGIESFIPLFKIVKYILDNLKDIYINLSEQEKRNYINKSIIWIKDIIKVIVRLISISEENYNNFKKCIIPLIGAFAEITSSLNNLKKSNLLAADLENSLYSDEIIYSLFIAIVYTRNENVIEMYSSIFDIKKNYNTISFKMDYLLYDINVIKESNLIWYFTVLFSYASFIRIFNNSLKNSPDSINKYFEDNFNINSGSRKDFNESVNSFVLLIKQLYSNVQNEKYNLKYKREFCKSNKNFFKTLIALMKTLLNVEYLVNFINIKINNSIFKDLSNLLKKNKIEFSEKDTEYKELIQSFYNYEDEKFDSYIHLKNNKSYKKIVTDELVDYHGGYHKVMKELFSFNRLWSKEKLFYEPFNKRTKNVKYKLINYYTRNFQRPIVYPVLDYKYRYPEFSKFKKFDTLYRDDSNEKNKNGDDYNFDFINNQFDRIVETYHRKIYGNLEPIKFKDYEHCLKLKKYEHSYAYDICFVKQGYHVKGNLFVIYLDPGLKIIFLSNSYNWKDGTTNKNKCNKDGKANNSSSKTDYFESLCYGQIFKCPKKEYNRKIEIDSNDIRMILQKIYYYRKSAVEIFTETKSYFFNFFSERDLEKFMDTIKVYLIKKTNYFMPIKYKKKKKIKIGYIKMKDKFVKKNKKTSFIDFISYNEGINKICHFDLIILMNLIGNRSYLDLTQYPVFPVLFFREKGNKQNLERKLDLHIGFQDLNKPSKARKDQFIKQYISDKTDVEDEEDENKENDLYYFTINYSTPIFVTDYLVRLFPYSLCSIELQGEEFDAPNRLFYSFEVALITVAEQTNALRELIPEFFYLPELFININNINLGTLSNESKVDDVIISKEIIQSELESYKQVFNNKIENENENKKNIFKAFITIIKMKDTLEGLKDTDLKNWLDLIFGEKQRYDDYKNKEGQFFTSVSYIDVDKNTLENNIKNNMDDVHFGLIPLKIIFDENKPNKINNEIQSPASETYYWDDGIKYKFEIKNENGQGKIEIYNENKILIDEIIDHSDEIIKKSYNRRLNMFATCSYDGLICIYIFPKKLISIIRHPQKLYFDEVYLSANPFPTVIAHDKKNCCLYCYSIYGVLINELKYDEIIGNIKDKKIDFTIDYILDVYGGCLWPKDLVNINYGSADKKTNISKWFELPFLNEIKVEKAFVEKAKKFVFKD